MKAWARMSKCGTYRYVLGRTWDVALPAVLFICLNPSTAGAHEDDRTSRVCIGYAQLWGFGTLLIGNLFALRSTDPTQLRKVVDPIGPQNNIHLVALHRKALLTVCAWGNLGSFLNRDSTILPTLRNPHCLVKLKSGRPGHPLYKDSALRPIPL